MGEIGGGSWEATDGYLNKETTGTEEGGRCGAGIAEEMTGKDWDRIDLMTEFHSHSSCFLSMIT